ncbi:MAG: adenylate/guanylate cyclase domain-containing protein [Pseudomonadota bacterium]
MSQQIKDWLASLGMQKYAEAFIDNDIGPDIIADLSDDEMKELGVSLGDRKRLRRSGQAPVTPEAPLRAPSEPTQNTAESANDQSATKNSGASGAERRNLTVMFCDLVGSTALSERFDPEELSDIVRGFQDACAGVISRYSGYIARYMGDGMLIYFGYPQAHEDDAERALRTGLEIIERVRALNLRPGLKLQTRIGVATGLVVVGESIGEASSREQVVLGETPNLAARLQSRAAPDQLVVGERTQKLCRNVFEYDNLGAIELKGFSAPVTAYRVVAAVASGSRFAARSGSHAQPLVGREQEYDLLRSRWSQAVRGDGQMVVLIGEAGIGKSRIVQALYDDLRHQTHHRINLQCSPFHTDSTLYPSIQQMRHAAHHFSKEQDIDFDAFEQVMQLSGAADDEQSALLAGLIGLDAESHYGPINLTPQQKRARTLQALKDQVIGLATQKPLLCVLEDVQWIDPTTRELLDMLLDAIEQHPVLILATTRPQNNVQWGGYAHVTQLVLNRLGRDHVSGIVQRLTGGKTLPADVLDEIAAKTDGVPLFVEELTKTVLESDLLRETDDGWVRQEDARSVAIPVSLHDSLMARLDRLKSAKDVAQAAACIGREFNRELLVAAVKQSEAELDRALDELIEVELVFRRSFDRSTFLFKHALVRDAAYESLLLSTRKYIHQQLMDSLIERDSPALEIIAWHAQGAEQTEIAIDYWQAAGEQALARPAYREAIGHLRNAIRLTKQMGEDERWLERELQLQIAIGQAMIASNGYAADPTVQTFGRALSLVDRLGDSPLRMPAVFGEWVTVYVSGAPFTKQVQHYATLANDSDDTGHHLIAQRLLGLDLIHKGQFARGLEHIENSLRLYDHGNHSALAKAHGSDPYTAALNYKCWALWYLGAPEQALDVGRASLEWAQTIKHVNTIGLARCWGIVLPNVLVGNTETVIDESRVLIEYAEEMSMSLWQAWGRIFLGWARATGERDSAGLEDIKAGLAAADSIGAGLLMPLFFCLKAESEIACGKFSAAELSVEAGFAAQARSGELVWSTRLHCAQGKLLASKLGDTGNESEQAYRQAIQIAREQGARSMELRAILGLAEMWSQSSHEIAPDDEANESLRERVVALIKPVFANFNEGHQTPDLRSARALLESRSADSVVS